MSSRVFQIPANPACSCGLGLWDRWEGASVELRTPVMPSPSCWNCRAVGDCQGEKGLRTKASPLLTQSWGVEVKETLGFVYRCWGGALLLEY